MIDPIDVANKLADARKLNNTVDTIKSFNTSNISTETFVGSLPPTLKKLPTIKDPRLQKRQLEADALKVQTKVQEVILMDKEILVEEAKKKISEYKSQIPRLPSIPKLSISDIKIIAEIEFSKLKQRVREEKQKLSKTNIKKSAEVFKFPMGKLPVKDIPFKIPEFPKIKPPEINIPDIDIPL